MGEKTVIPGAMVEETAICNYNVRAPAPEFVRQTAVPLTEERVRQIVREELAAAGQAAPTG